MSQAEQSVEFNGLTRTREGEESTQHHGECAYVLAETDETARFGSTPTVILCSNCGEQVTAYHRGLPRVVTTLDEKCSTCNVSLRRWCTAAIDAAYVEAIDSQKLTKMTQRYWDEWLWAGITTHKEQPRNDEYVQMLSEKSSEFGWDWEPSCPLCRRTFSQLREECDDFRGSLDYHHWSKDPDLGVTLCRECHDVIGFDRYDNQLETLAHDWGLRSCNDLQTLRLSLRDALVCDQRVRPERAELLVDRYNLIQSTNAVHALLEAIVQDDELRNRVVDDTLQRGL